MAKIESYVRPQWLYRYRSLEHFERELEAIEQSYLYCAAFHQLNDPMEGTFTSSRLLKKSEEYRAIRNAVIDNKARIGMCSFSEVHDNELMWAHYADHFKGICVAYRFALLRKSLGDDVRFVRMYYNETEPMIRSAATEPERLAKMVLSYKYYRWLYEREWRMFASLGKACYHKVECVARVYLGSRIDPTYKKRIRRRLKPLGIKTKDMTIEEYFISFE